MEKTAVSIDADKMSVDELRTAILIGIEDVKNGDVVAAAEGFAEFRKKHKC